MCQDLKPWLLSLLACPIDKHHPLEAYFFSWEKGDPGEYSLDQIEKLKKQLGDGTISLDSIKEIRDQTGNSYSDDLHSRIMQFIDADLVGWHLEALNQYLNVLDVREGILVCPLCGRWYPIGSSVVTVPVLMPDHFRDNENDAVFLEKWRDIIPIEVKERIGFE